MGTILATGGSGISDAITNFGTVLSEIASVITGNVILFTMFAGGLLAVGAKVFKRIKNASK